MINRGSEWRKWDLHLHSCFSVLNNNYDHNSKGGIGDNETDKFIEKIKENNIDVVGLTNYFKFTDEDFQLKKKMKKAGITTFLNLEVRLSNINKSDELFDYHIIFDDKLDDQVIKDLLANFKANIGSTEKSFTQLSKEEIENTASIDFDKLVSVLEEEGNQVSNRYLLGFLSRGHGSATSNKDTKNKSVFENITRKSDFLIHASTNPNNLKKDREIWLYRMPYVRPLLQSSDAHDLDHIGKQYSWIKANTTFEGFRQILFEPEDRISLQIEKPERKNDYQVIDYVEIDDDKIIQLNPNLNTVVGGRSTGKSTFTNSIAKKLNNLAFDSKKMHTYCEDSDETLKIYWQDGKIDDSREVEFLPQDYMIQLAENPDQRKKLIDSIIKNKDQGALYQEISNYDSKVSANKIKISVQLQDYFNTKQKLKGLTKPEGDKEGIEEQIEKITNEQKDKRKESNFSDEDSIAYDELVVLLAEKELEKNLIADNLSGLENLEISDLKLNKDISTIDVSISQPLLEKLDEIEKHINSEWSLAIMDIELKLKQRKKDLDKEIEEISECQAYQKGKINILNNQSLKILEEKLREEKLRLTQLEEYENEKIKLKDDLRDKQQQILATYSNYSQYRKELEENFNIKTDKVEIKLVFQPEDFFGNILDGRSIEKIKFINDFNKNPDEKINHIFEELNLSYNKKTASEHYSQDDLIKELLSKDWYSYNFLLQYDGDDFNEMSQGKKAFVILNLILEFSDDRKPVIIDQPEDSLDNRAIYNDLTKYLKSKKKQRQIIIVTHNPNVVVGADAENVIVANQHSMNTPNKGCMKFDYINGALESIEAEDLSCEFVLSKQSVRDHMFEILEGGKEAFEKRENKYNLGKIKKI